MDDYFVVIDEFAAQLLFGLAQSGCTLDQAREYLAASESGLHGYTTSGVN